MMQDSSTAHTFLYKWFVSVDTNTFQPKIGFKTRYGLVGNPFAQGRDAFTPAQVAADGLVSATNAYYRLFAVTNLHGNTA